MLGSHLGIFNKLEYYCMSQQKVFYKSQLKPPRCSFLPLTLHKLFKLLHFSMVHQDDNSTFKILTNLLLFPIQCLDIYLK